MDPRHALRLLSIGRVVVGASLTLAPGRAGRNWIGDSAADPAVKVFARALGVRDLALGVGTIATLDEGGQVRTWALLGAGCDAVDAAATLVAIRKIGVRRALPALAVATTATVVGLLAASEADGDAVS